MQRQDETPVIFRRTREGDVIALLPTIPLEGIATSIIAYSMKYGFFTTDISIMHSTSVADGANVWPILSALIIKENIKPVRVVQRITEEMNELRLNNNEARYVAA